MPYGSRDISKTVRCNSKLWQVFVGFRVITFYDINQISPNFPGIYLNPFHNYIYQNRKLGELSFIVLRQEKLKENTGPRNVT